MCHKIPSLLSDSPKQFPKLALYGFSSVCGKPNPMFLGSFGCSGGGLRIIDDKKKARYHVDVREKSEESRVKIVVLARSLQPNQIIFQRNKTKN